MRGIWKLVAVGLMLSAFAGCGGDSGSEEAGEGSARVPTSAREAGFRGPLAKAYAIGRRVCGLQPKSEFIEESGEVPPGSSDAEVARAYASEWPAWEKHAVRAGCLDGLAGVPDEPIPSAPEAAELWGKEFAVISVEAAPGMVEPPIERADAIRIGFTSERDHGLYWDGLCNSNGGRVRITATQLEIYNSGGTLVGCTEGRGEEEDWISRFLVGGPEWSLDDDRLTLRSDSAVVELEPAGDAG